MQRKILNMKILFLDIDGVLNCDSSISRCQQFIGIDKDKVRRLAHIIDKTKASIVLTSSWKIGWHPNRKYSKREFYHAYYLDTHLYKKGKVRISARTYDDRDSFRGGGIQKFLKEYPEVKQWVVLDDFLFPDYEKENILPHLVLTDPKYGLQDEDAEVAIQILNQERVGPYKSLSLLI